MTAPLKTDPERGTVGYDQHGNLVDIGMQAVVKRRDALFLVHPFCKMCRGAIAERQDAHLQSLADGSEYLIHAGCFTASIQSMANRYFGRGLV